MEVKVNQSVSELEKELAEKEAENSRLRYRIRLLEKALFGPRSEREVDSDDGQLEFDELMKELAELTDELDAKEDKQEERKKKRKPAKKKKRRTLEELLADADIEEEVNVIDVDPDDKISLETGEPLKEIDRERNIKIVYVPGHYRKVINEYIKYVDPADPGRGVVRAPKLPSLLPGSQFDESFIADVCVEKAAYHMPIYRQTEKLNGKNIPLSRQTLTRLYVSGAFALLPLFELMKEIILSGSILFTDDTPVRLQVKGKGKTKEGRMWVYVGGGNSPPFKVFEFTEDRKKKRPKEFLLGGPVTFSGFIHADAYKGYDDLFLRKQITECACWMHIRRKYIEALDAPIGLRRTMLAGIRLIYRYERQLKNDNADDAAILKVRQEKTAPLIDKLVARAKKAIADKEVLPASKFAGAIGYMLNLGDAIKTFTTNARLSPDNGESERALRALAIGRKNWLFAGSKDGGDATGILLSLIQSAKGFGHDPYTYLYDIMKRLPLCEGNKEEMRQLLPDLWKPLIHD